MSFLKGIEDKKPEALKQKELKEKHLKTIQQIRKLDRGLVDINFEVAMCLKRIYMGLAGEKQDLITSSSTLVEVSIDN